MDVSAHRRRFGFDPLCPCCGSTFCGAGTEDGDGRREWKAEGVRMGNGEGERAGGQDASLRGKEGQKKQNKKNPEKITQAWWITHTLFSPQSLTLHQTPICPPFMETWIFLIPSLIKITYIKEHVRLHQGFHHFYNEVNAETQWLPQQCKWRPNDNLHYLNKVIAITLRYSNEDRCFELEHFELAAPSPKNVWKGMGGGLTLEYGSVCIL